LTRLPRATGREVLAALQRDGFVLTHVRGSHHYLHKPGVSGLVVVPVHGGQDLPAGTLRSILRQASMTADELRKLL
jgi:predicted RNA binding protein YcfA (HicA-like mRNA interferase family)